MAKTDDHELLLAKNERGLVYAVPTVTLDDDMIYFGVTVTRARAEYLMKCLTRDLCEHCGRELDECEADPCTGRGA